MKNKLILLLLIIFFIISILTIYSTTNILPSYYKFIHYKQLIWYVLGFFIIFILYKNKNGFFYKYDKLLYIIFNIFLLLVLIFGEITNGSKAWFNIPGIGSFQPSEFMKIILIIFLSNILNKANKHDLKSEFITIIKCLIITLIPAILTFLEPDTGNVIIYFIILFTMIFIYGISYKWYIFLLIMIIPFTFIIFNSINNQNKINSIINTEMIYRIERLFEWKNNEGMQLENALASIGSAPKNGYGIKNTPIYIPEAHTDFISSILFSTFGFSISITIILLFALFDIIIITIAYSNSKKNKYLISGIISIILFQQVQNIGMNIGLLPITGITLPFISYGGSSLICYMIMIGLIFNINKKKKEL